eukprot:TRINITY_DN20181_c0_g1_i2.p1 TRINITY_DN20181_c0_g1~~TRINITY_DN20181_c0_g1_i2.p1  ORF type:complete len:403 (-),score=59.78 TRINITY_DN20181_c0_g1_i2:254-1387(-)
MSGAVVVEVMNGPTEDRLSEQLHKKHSQIDPRKQTFEPQIWKNEQPSYTEKEQSDIEEDEEEEEEETEVVEHQSAGSSRQLRKRMLREREDPEYLLRDHINPEHKLIIFSGSGLSASSGMSMFSTEDGLYDRAKKRFRVADGKRLFQYGFYEKSKKDVNKFYCDIYKETLKATPSHGHISIRMLYQQNRVQRHYTLNVDGLMDKLGVPQWHANDGNTVEVHGNLRELFCPSCGATTPTNGSHIQTMRRKEQIICKRCYQNTLRFKMVLYEDPDTDKITSEDIWELLQADLQVADAVLWVGISFEQSASLEYFRKVVRILQDSDRENQVKQLVVNIDEDALHNIQLATSSNSSQKLVFVKMAADEALTQLAQQSKYNR